MCIRDSNNVTTWNRIKDSDIYYNFIKSPTAIISSAILIIIFFSFLIIYEIPNDLHTY